MSFHKAEGPIDKAEMSITLALSPDETGKLAVVTWSISSNYPTSSPPGGHCGPEIRLFMVDKLINQMACDKRDGIWTTNETYLPGLRAVLEDWDCESQKFLKVCEVSLAP